MEDVDNPMAYSPAAPFPPYLTLITHLLFGFSAITRSKILSGIGIAYGSYWMLKLALYPPTKLINSTFFRDANDFTRISKTKRDEPAETQPRKITQTVIDAIEVGFVAGRGIGWNFQIRIDTPRQPPNYPRGRFVVERLCNAIIHLIMFDMASFYIRRHTPLGTLPVTQLLTSQPLYLALPRAWLIYCMNGRWFMTGFYDIVCAVTVALHIYSPYDCPPLFGPWSRAYTVRNFWAFTWHQMMRPIAQPSTAAAARFFGLPKNSRLTFYFKVSGAFFFAWAQHAYGTLIAGGDVMDDVWRYAPQILLFFVEDHVVLIAKSFGVKNGSWAKTLGYLWVFVAEGLTLVWWYDSVSKAGSFVDLQPVSKICSPSEWLYAQLT